MALPSPFSLPHSEFNEFLFAPIGEEKNGTSLSVVSALARLDIDPWQEASRLADLPRELATAALDRLIRRLPAGRWDQSDSRKITARLIDLLPRRGVAAPASEVNSAGHRKVSPTAVVVLIAFALGAAALFGVSGNRMSHSDERAGSAAISNGPSPPTDQ